MTHAIVSHHHDDHARGLRAAVSAGITIISHHSNEGTFRELTERRTTKYHDALSRNFQLMKFVPVKDHIELKDSRMEVDIYHVINNTHMASGVIAHVPAHRILVEADSDDPRLGLSVVGRRLWTTSRPKNRRPPRVAGARAGGERGGAAGADREAGGRREGALCQSERGSTLPAGCPVQYTREPVSPQR